MKTVKFVNAARRAAAPPSEPSGDISGGWRVETCLGAQPVGGLMLPAGHPTASFLYAPRGVHLGRVDGQDVLIAADTGNHRVMIWRGLPDEDGQPCDLVLGQPDPTSEGPAAGGRSVRYGMNLPTGVLVHDDMLIVADAWHHRVLIYRQLPETGDTEPDIVLGQPDLDSVEPNGGGECSATSMYWPFGVGVIDGRFYVADTGNRRVLCWTGGVPTSADTPPDVIIGQPTAADREENRGGPASRSSFRWPHSVAGTPEQLVVADAGNHRLLGWGPHPTGDQGADQVIGQPDFDSSTEWPYGPQSADKLRFPYAVDIDAGRLAVGDTANNRILLWDTLPHPADGEIGPPADAVLGQPSFSANGENRWESVTPDSLCWPYGLSLRGDLLAVADSGNNRVVIWRRT